MPNDTLSLAQRPRTWGEFVSNFTQVSIIERLDTLLRSGSRGVGVFWVPVEGVYNQRREEILMDRGASGVFKRILQEHHVWASRNSWPVEDIRLFYANEKVPLSSTRTASVYYAPYRVKSHWREPYSYEGFISGFGYNADLALRFSNWNVSTVILPRFRDDMEVDDAILPLLALWRRQSVSVGYLCDPNEGTDGVLP